MPRPIWKGSISFGLVMIPVTLHSGASTKAELDLDMLDSKDQSRIRFKRVNESTGKEVSWASIVKGFQYEDGKYVILTPQDFKAAAKGVVRGGIDIIDFVDRDSISPRYFEKPYFLEPGKNGEKVYALLRESLRKSNRIGIAKIVLQTRQNMAALIVEDDALVLITMRFPDELREPSDLALPPKASLKASSKEVEMAMKLIDGMTADWDPSKYRDEYTASLRAVIKHRSKSPAGGPPDPETEEDDEIPETYNIMDMLRKSVDAAGKPARSASAKPPAKRQPNRHAARPIKTASSAKAAPARLKRKAG